MAMPSGWRSSEPMPVPRASGSAPSRAQAVVIMIGRKRSRQARRIASCAFDPARLASMAKSTIMMPFFLTMPSSRMMPTMPSTDRLLPNSISASRAPTPAGGRVEMMVMGWIQLSYSTPSTM